MKLSDYSAFLPGLTYAPTDVKNDGLLVLRSSNIQNGQLSFLDNVYVDTEIVPNRIRTKEKDVLMCVRNGSKALVGKTALITSEYADLAWGAFMTVLRPKRHNTFLFQYLNSSSFKTQVFPDLDTATVKQITMGTLNGVHIYVPSLPEQEKIAFFLQWIDARIEKQHNLIETLKKYKRGAVKRIFANKGDWAKYKISDIAHIATGHSNTQDKAEDGAFPFFIRSQTVARSNRYLYDGEAVLTIGDGQIGKVFHYYVGKFDCHQRVYMMTQFKNTTGKYFYHYFASFFYDRVIRMSAKNTVDSVRYDMIAEMPIYIPSPETQQKIVKALDLLDARITTAESLLDLYEKEKNALLQKMFI